MPQWIQVSLFFWFFIGLLLVLAKLKPTTYIWDRQTIRELRVMAACFIGVWLFFMGTYIPKEVIVEPTKQEILVELLECSEQIDNDQYTPAQRQVLRELEAERLVALRWVLTPKGKEAALKK